MEASAATSRSIVPARTWSISACVKVCMSKNAPSAIASGISSVAELADQVGDAGVVDHHLDRRDPAAVDLRKQALADDAAEDAGQ